jgi:transposase
LDTVIDRCAGLDVHKDSVVACVRLTDPATKVSTETGTFGTTTAELTKLLDWLVAQRVTLVGMESTGVYWKPVFYMLEGSMECWLLNARHLKAVPGRKTDVKDAEWIAQLVAHGLVRPSFVPPKPIRALRELTRYRRAQIDERAREAQRLDKVLQDAGIKLSSVATDVFGKSGQAMLKAMVSGTTDPEALAELALGKLRKKIPALHEALEGNFDAHHRVVVSSILAKLEFLDSLIDSISVEIDKVMAPFVQKRDLLATMPGIDKRLAEAILAEIGPDMSRFPTPGHLASWAGMCPGQHESAGKRRAVATPPGNRHLQASLRSAAMAAARSKNTYHRSLYYSLVARRGKKKALKAVGHSILVAIHHMLSDDVSYQDLGPDYLIRRRDPKSVAMAKIRELNRLGFIVTANHDGTFTITPPETNAAA